MKLKVFEWTNKCDKAFWALKLMLSQAPIIQPAHWDLPFNFFVDVLDVAIGAVLMQESKPRWNWPIYYAS